MTAIGQIPHRSFILAVSLSPKCEVTTTEEHGYHTFDFVRLTNMVGMAQIEGDRFRIIVTDVDKFTIQDPITFEDIDSTGYTPYIADGNCNLIEQTYYYYGEPQDV